MNELGEIRLYAAGLFAVFGLATGLVAVIYLISAGIEIGGRVLWPGKPPGDSEVE